MVASKSSFCRQALQQLRDQAVQSARNHPPLHHMLVLPPGESIRPMIGCHPVGHRRSPTISIFGKSKIATHLPPELCWPKSFKPFQAVVAEQAFHPYRPCAQEPYRVHLFFGNPKGWQELKSLTTQIVDLKREISDAIGEHRSPIARSIQLGPIYSASDCIQGEEQEAIDSWMCTIHTWSWKVTASDLHVNPRVMFGKTAIETNYTERAVFERLSFSYIPHDLFTISAATIELLLRFLDLPPSVGWESTYPPRLESDDLGQSPSKSSSSAASPGMGVAPANSLDNSKATSTISRSQTVSSPQARPSTDSSGSSEYVFRKGKGSHWIVRFGLNDVETTYNDLRGFHIIAKLLAHPNPDVPFKASIFSPPMDRPSAGLRTEQQAVEEGLSPHKPTVDVIATPEGVASLHKRLRQLEEEREFAIGQGDEVRLERLDYEKDALIKEVARIHKSGNRDHALEAGNLEREAWDRVRKALGTAYESLKQHHGGLFEHLDKFIVKDQYTFAYRPNVPIDWDL